MKKIRLLQAIILAVILAFGVIGMTGCGNADTGDSEYGTFQLVLNAGETYTVHPERFSFLDFNVGAVELVVAYETHENVVAVNGNTITALNNGRAEIVANVRERNVRINRRRYNRTGQFQIGEVRVLNEAEMTEIWTAQDLADMNNDLDGSFILRDNIDLADWCNWTPIGGIFRNGFRGSFINPNDYKITNLYINTVGGQDDETFVTDKGLFRSIAYAFISGIILENVNIRALENEGESFPRSVVGGIAASVFRSTIVDVSVSGNLVGNHRVGGIAGSKADSQIINSSFNGYVEATWHTGDVRAGGIAGEMHGLYRPPWRRHRGLVMNATVTANIKSYMGIAGGVVGTSFGWWNHENTFDIVNSTFEGNLTGRITDTLRGHGAH